MNGRKSKPEPSAWKNGIPKKQELAPTSGRGYVPPSMIKSEISPSALKTSIYETTPDLPQKLVDEFKAQPKNYPGLIPALHDGETFAIALEKWNKLGVLYAEDIIKNAPPDCPIDYHLRVSENDTQTAYG